MLQNNVGTVISSDSEVFGIVSRKIDYLTISRYFLLILHKTLEMTGLIFIPQYPTTQHILLLKSYQFLGKLKPCIRKSTNPKYISLRLYFMKNRLPTFIKLPRYKRFNYKPVFYDAEKEDLEQRVARIEKEVAAEKRGELNSDLLRQRLRSDWERGSRQGIIQKSNIRVALIAVFLFAVIYLYLNS